ncbi:MAG: SDR family oxidoreductase [Campylobacterales bacterium]
MKQKIVILGVRGMAGHIIAKYLDSCNRYEIFGIARNDGEYVHSQIDVLDKEALEQYIKHIRPDIVINCIGMLVSQSNEDVVNAIKTNALLPHELSTLGNKIGFRLIHLSTDCVFSGRDGGYTESSPKDGLDNYAKSKALGEVCNDKDLTIRTSIIGPELKDGTGLLNWFLRQEGKIRGYTHAYWTGVTTLELAKVIDKMIEQNITGLYHLCPKERISKYDLLHLFKKVWEKDIDIEPFEDYTIDKSLICTRSDFVYNDIDYESMLIDLRQWMDKYKDCYL